MAPLQYRIIGKDSFAPLSTAQHYGSHTAHQIIIQAPFARLFLGYHHFALYHQVRQAL